MAGRADANTCRPSTRPATVGRRSRGRGSGPLPIHVPRESADCCQRTRRVHILGVTTPATGEVRNGAAHIAAGVDLDGVKHVLRIWVQASERARFWAGCVPSCATDALAFDPGWNPEPDGKTAWADVPTRWPRTTTHRQVA
jgi:Transposase, Mutator family